MLSYGSSAFTGSERYAMTEPQAARPEAVPALGMAAYSAGFIRTAVAGKTTARQTGGTTISKATRRGLFL
jgi:hypothetical protein